VDAAAKIGKNIPSENRNMVFYLKKNKLNVPTDVSAYNISLLLRFVGIREQFYQF